jgi:hypothetical protein
MPKGKPGSWEYGTNSGYQQGCRLECCRAAHAAYNAERRREARARRQPSQRGGYAHGRTLEELLAEW